MKLSDFYLKLAALCDQPDAHPDINVIICTLNEEHLVGCVEFTKDIDGNIQIQINSNESVE
jgi:hypothetical protein